MQLTFDFGPEKKPDPIWRDLYSIGVPNLVAAGVFLKLVLAAPTEDQLNFLLQSYSRMQYDDLPSEVRSERLGDISQKIKHGKLAIKARKSFFILTSETQTFLKKMLKEKDGDSLVKEGGRTA